MVGTVTMLNEVRTFDFYCSKKKSVVIVLFVFPIDNGNGEDTRNNTLINDAAMDVDVTVAADTDVSSFVTFDCIEPYCVKQFRREDRLQAHLLIGSHKNITAPVRLLDRAVLMYQDSLLSDHPKQIPILSASVTAKTHTITPDIILQEGWAIFYPRPKVLFTDAQRSFLNKKYDEGENQGKKWDPAAVAEASLFFKMLYFSNY